MPELFIIKYYAKRNLGQGIKPELWSESKPIDRLRAKRFVARLQKLPQVSRIEAFELVAQ